MAARRSYDDGCAAAHALDLVGERWALLVVRELLFGPKRFTDLRKGLPNASPNVLTQRLRELEETGVVRRRTLPPPAASKVYELTGWGRELEPVIVSLGRWGARSAIFPLDAGIGVNSIVLALKTMFDSGADEFEADYELRLGEDRFHVAISGRKFEVSRGDAELADARITTDPVTLRGLVFEGLPLDKAKEAGAATVEGDESKARRLLTLFSLPETASSVERT